MQVEMNKYYLKNNDEYNAVSLRLSGIVLPLIGLIVAIICATVTVSEGLEFRFLLPFTFSVSTVLFNRAYVCWKDNIGLVIIFLSIVVRYLITPLFMTLAQSPVDTLQNTSEAGFKWAIIISIFELFVVLAVIDRVWLKYKKKRDSSSQSSTNSIVKSADFKLSFFGMVMIIMLVFLVISRGHFQNVWSHMSTWWYTSEERTDLYIYDLMALEIIKSAITLVLVSFLARRYHKSKGVIKYVFLALALSIALANTMFYQYTQRSALTQLILSTMFMMIAFFPGQKKLLLLLFGIGGSGFVVYVFASSTLLLSIETNSNNIFEGVSKMLELYVTGPSVLGNTHDTFYSVRSAMSIETLWSDFTTTVHIFGLFPFLRFIPNSAIGIPNTNELFMRSIGGLTYILPNYRLCTYYVGQEFGWLLEIVVVVLAMKGLCFIDKVKKKYNDGLFYYSFAYMEIIIGQMIFINNFYLLAHTFTSLTVWLLIFAFVNQLRSKQRSS